MPFGYHEFREVEACRLATRSFLESDVGRLLIRVLRQKYTAVDVPSNADALSSARVLSQLHGAHAALDDIERACLPPGQEVALESTFTAPETDHERMPYEVQEGFRPEIRTVPPPIE